ncbi:MAG: glycosyltransferase [Phycisphaera sp.]|nr:glycosyltransferase [Phycisphaera sp.]
MQVLHLIDADGPHACPTTLALLSDAMGRLGDIGQRVFLLGGEQLGQDAVGVGLSEVSRGSVPLGKPLLGWPVLRRFLREFGPFDLVHCWSVASLTLASLVMRRTPRLLTLTHCPTDRQAHWVRTLTRNTEGSTTILTVSAMIRRSLLTRGVGEHTVHTLRPAIDLSRVVQAQRAAIRNAWKASDSHRVIGVLSDDPRMTDARTVTLAASILQTVQDQHNADRSDASNWRIAMHPDLLHRLGSAESMRALGRHGMVITDGRLAAPWSVLPGCDFAVVTEGSTMSTLWAMAANVPIVGLATYENCEVLEDRHSALLAKPDGPRVLAHRLEQLDADKQLAWKLRDTARHEAYSFFSRKRYCDDLATVYRQIVEDRAVAVPAMASTGGLRFEGRG